MIDIKKYIGNYNINALKNALKLHFENIKYVASFISIRSEISTNQLNKKIIELNKILTFPVIKYLSKLIFLLISKHFFLFTKEASFLSKIPS